MSRNLKLSICCVLGCFFAACRPNADSKGGSQENSGVQAKADRPEAPADRGTATTDTAPAKPATVVSGSVVDPPAPPPLPDLRTRASDPIPVQSEAAKPAAAKPTVASPADVNLGSTPTAAPEPDPGSSIEDREQTEPDGALTAQWMVKVYPDGREVRHGPSRTFHANGQPYLVGEYVDGARNGLWLTWYPSGKQRGRGTLDKEARLGTWTMWYENGNKRSETVYQKGEKNGPWSSWDEQGQLTESGNYLNDMKHGVWVTYGEQGNVETKWKEDQVVVD